MISTSEIAAILRDLSAGSRVVTDWQPTDELERQQVKLAFLILQCFQTAMPWGGHVTVTMVAQQWAIHGQADQMKIDRNIWRGLEDLRQLPDVASAQVHFALAPLAAAAIERNLSIEISDNSARVRF